MDRPLQLFSDEYLEHCRSLTSEQIVAFLDQFRMIAYAGRKKKTKLISIKVPEDLLECFKTKARLEGRPYQSLIKQLMEEWLG